MVTKEELNAALEAWEVARDRASLEQAAFGVLIQNHAHLIGSLRSHGHSWAQATVEFDKFSKTHQEALIAAWKAMNERCAEYHDLNLKLKAQNPGTETA